MIKKILSILSCYLLIHSFPVYSQNFDNDNNQNMSTSYNNDCTDYPVVSAIKRKIFGSTFQDENIYQRVNRLEKAVIGTNFPQESLRERVDRISKAASDEDSGEYNRPTAQQYNAQSPLTFPWKDTEDSFSDNSSCNNQTNNTFQSPNIVQKMINFAGSRFNNNTFNSFGSDPYFEQEINKAQNLNFGVGVRILP